MISELELKVIKWADDKRLIPPVLDKVTALSQYTKTVEEVSEIGVSIAKLDEAGVKDGIGDVLVTLIIQAEMWGLTLEDCLEAAYNEIKDRTGTLQGGVFVKDEA